MPLKSSAAMAKTALAKPSGGRGRGGSRSSATTGLESHGILEGISSLHSWIKTQTMIRPNPRTPKGRANTGLFDESSSVLSFGLRRRLRRPRLLSFYLQSELDDTEDGDEDVVITLTSRNPQASSEVVRFDYTSGEWVSVKLDVTSIEHLDIESTCLHKDSNEAKKQIQRDNGIIRNDRVFQRVVLQRVAVASAFQMSNDEEENEDNEEDNSNEAIAQSTTLELANPKNGEDESEKSMSVSMNADKLSESSVATEKAKVQNQFSFVERATQTMNNALRCESMQTEPASRCSFSDSVNQWLIFDAYNHHEKLKEQQEERERMRHRVKDNQLNTYNIRRVLSDRKVEPRREVEQKMLRAARIIERMINQNACNDIALDFKYWEDASDEYRDEEGTLLPLWKFSFETSDNSGREVTCLAWNPLHADLFAVGYGSYDFYAESNSRRSQVCVFSLKNASYPEFVCHTSTAVFSLSFHPDHAHVLAAGLFDGSVALFDLQRDNPSRASHVTKQEKHEEIVWQVRFATDDLDNRINLYSVGGDGKVKHWVIVRASITCHEVIAIEFSKRLEHFTSDEIKRYFTEGGRCLAFSPGDPSTFLVGSDEGLVYKCTTEYSSKYLEIFHAHNASLHCVEYNGFVSDVFLSCGFEWSIKIFDHSSTKPLFMFDLNSVVSCVCWSPFSATVFAAVTMDGRVHVFDLAVDKYKAICSQPIVSRKKAGLNAVAFNHNHPVLIVGDTKGFVHCLKLSPNLRRQSKDVRNALANREMKKARELEARKLETILAMVREPSDNNDNFGQIDDLGA